MRSENFTFKSEDGVQVTAFKWLPEENAGPKAVVQISHGMAEHSARYERFAGTLVKAGYAAFSNDHRGHGKTAGPLENVGFFAEENGWRLVVEDMRRLTDIIKKEYPDIPVFLFGHSMGSILSRSYIFSYGRDIKGVILSGTGGDPGLLGKIGMLITKLEIKRKGKKYRSPLLTRLSFGNFNSSFKPNRTDFDWLSRDETEVDKYIDDPYCGGMFTAGFYLDLLKGLDEVNSPDNMQKVPHDLPIFIFSGDKDPVGKDTKGVMQVYRAYRKAGVKDVSHKFYTGGRHEILSETNREEVYADVIRWLDERCYTRMQA